MTAIFILVCKKSDWNKTWGRSRAAKPGICHTELQVLQF